MPGCQTMTPCSAPTPVGANLMKLLHVDSSILGSHSVSRQLSAEIVAAERLRHPGLEVVYRDLGVAPVGHLSGAHLAAAQGAVPETMPLQQDLASWQAGDRRVVAWRLLWPADADCIPRSSGKLSARNFWVLWHQRRDFHPRRR